MASPSPSFARNIGPLQEIKIDQARLDIDPSALRQCFDREPFEFTHNLSDLDLFRDDSLHALAETFSDAPRDYFIAGSAPSPGAKFYDIPNGGMKPVEALENLDHIQVRILLKRPENHDPRFRDLMQGLFKQIADLQPSLSTTHIIRLESAILISSSSTTTPIHFDPEVGFFSQIEGQKLYHVYPPACAPETELEQFYIGGRIDIGNVDLAKLDAARERVYMLGPGKGFHQPQNSPHWVETGNLRSVSYTFVFETDSSRALGRTRAFNYCIRRVGLSVSRPGVRPSTDAAKAFIMRAAKPLQFFGRVVRKMRRMLREPRLASH